MSYTPSPFAWAGFPLTTFTEKDRRYVEMDASEFPSLEDVCRGQGLRALGSASSTRGAEHRPPMAVVHSELVVAQRRKDGVTLWRRRVATLIAQRDPDPCLRQGPQPSIGKGLGRVPCGTRIAQPVGTCVSVRHSGLSLSCFGPNWRPVLLSRSEKRSGIGMYSGGLAFGLHKTAFKQSYVKS